MWKETNLVGQHLEKGKEQGNPEAAYMQRETNLIRQHVEKGQKPEIAEAKDANTGNIFAEFELGKANDAYYRELNKQQALKETGAQGEKFPAAQKMEKTRETEAAETKEKGIKGLISKLFERPKSDLETVNDFYFQELKKRDELKAAAEQADVNDETKPPEKKQHR